MIKYLRKWKIITFILSLIMILTIKSYVSAEQVEIISGLSDHIITLMEYIDKNGVDSIEKYDFTELRVPALYASYKEVDYRKTTTSSISIGELTSQGIWKYDKTTGCNILLENFNISEGDRDWIIEQFGNIEEVGRTEKIIITFFDKYGIDHSYLKDILLYISYNRNSRFILELEKIYTNEVDKKTKLVGSDTNSINGASELKEVTLFKDGKNHYFMKSGNDQISLNSGASKLEYELVNLKGKGDMNLVLPLEYNSDDSNLFSYSTELRKIKDYSYNTTVEYKSKTRKIGEKQWHDNEIDSFLAYKDGESNEKEIFNNLEKFKKEKAYGVKKNYPSEGYETRFYFSQDTENNMAYYPGYGSYNKKYGGRSSQSGVYFATGWKVEFSKLRVRYGRVASIYIPAKGHFEVVEGKIKKYKLNDIQEIVEKNYNNKHTFEKGINFIVKYTNGYKEYFDEYGYLKIQEDRFGNRNYFEIQYYFFGADVTLEHMRVTDSVGRVVDIRRIKNEYKYEVRVDGKLLKTIYIEGYIPAVKLGNRVDFHNEKFTLTKIVDSENRESNFKYRYEVHKTNLLGEIDDKDDTIENYYVLLDSVDTKYGEKIKYNYEKIIINNGLKGNLYKGKKEKYRVTLKQEFDENWNLMKKTQYSYVNNNTGYPKYRRLSGELPYEYSTEITENNIKSRYTFNEKHLLIKEEKWVKSNKIAETTKLYDDKEQIVKAKTVKLYNNMELENIENYEFDDKGHITSYTGIKAKRNNEEKPKDLSNTVKYSYYDDNDILREKKYYVENDCIREVNYLAGDKKTIIETRVLKNNVLCSKETYQYDSFGNMIGKKIYGKNDNWNEFIQVYFGYNGQGGRDAYQTSKTVKGVTNAAFGDVQDITESSKYTNEGFVKETTDGNGNVERYTYDSIGRILSLTKVADNSRVSYSYDNKNRTTTFTNENGDSFKFKYNYRGKIEDIISVKDGKTLYHYDYDNQGRLVRETISEKGYYRYTYYDDNRIKFKEALQKNPNGTETLLGKSEFIYEDVIRDSVTGQVVTRNRTILHGDSNSPTREKREIYNQYGEMIRKEVLNSGTIYKETYTYDSIGREIQRKSPRGFQENWGNQFSFKTEYDFRGNVLATTDVYGYSNEYIYDKLGNQIKARNKKNRAKNRNVYINTKHDEMGRVIESSIPQSFSEETRLRTRYDKNSNMILSSIEIAKNDFRVKEMGYNHLNQLNMVKLNDGHEDMYTEYLYDKKGNMINIALGLEHKNSDIYTDKTIDYKYDELSQVVGKNGQADNYTLYEKDHYGNTEKKSEPNGNKISTEYDGLNRITSRIIKNKQNQVIESLQFRYSLAGEVVEIIKDGKSRKYTYDSMGRLKTDTDYRGYKKTSHYDSESNLTNLTVYKSGREIYDVSYVMDRMNRIHQVKKDGAVIATYEYDQNGNRKSVKFSNGFRTTYQYNLSNKLIRLENYRDYTQGSILMSAFDYEYTLDGNVKKENRYVNSKLVDETTFKYDKADRLIEEKSSNINNSYSYDRYHNRTSSKSEGLEELLENVSYGYDGMNRLTSIQKSSKNIQFTYDIGELRESKTVNGQRTDFIYQGNYLLIEDKGNTITKNIVGAGIIAREIEGALYYYIYDGLGNVTSITDSQGNIIKNYRYDAYGVEQNKDDNDNNPFRYKGYFYDKDSDLYYLGARFYNANTGRFINEDTNQGKISKPQSLNYYIYCSGNPVRYYDPDGHEPINGDDRVHGVPEGEKPWLVIVEYDDAEYTLYNEAVNLHEIYLAEVKMKAAASRGMYRTNDVSMLAPAWELLKAKMKHSSDKWKAQRQVEEYYKYGTAPWITKMQCDVTEGALWGTVLQGATHTIINMNIPKGTSKAGVLDNANFAQKTYRAGSFSDEGIQYYSKIAGKDIVSVDDLVGAIKSGEISPSQIPIDYVVRDGNTLILNTRSSQALTQAGIPRSQWNAVNRTGQELYEGLLTGQLTRNKLTSEGISTVRPSNPK